MIRLTRTNAAIVSILITAFGFILGMYLTSTRIDCKTGCLPEVSNFAAGAPQLGHAIHEYQISMGNWNMQQGKIIDPTRGFWDMDVKDLLNIAGVATQLQSTTRCPAVRVYFGNVISSDPTVNQFAITSIDVNGVEQIATGFTALINRNAPVSRYPCPRACDVNLSPILPFIK